MKTFLELFYESINQDVKKLIDKVKNINISNNIGSTNAFSLYMELIRKIRDYKYETSVEFIDKIVHDPKLKFLLSLGYGGDYADLKLNIVSRQLPTAKLIPTQSEIDMTNSLKYTLQGKDIDVCFYDPVVIIRPIITFNGKYIIDGHHRWSQIFITNPKSNLACLDIQGRLSPLDMLKAVQSTIGSNLGYLESRDTKGTSLYTATENTIRRYIESNISKKTIAEFNKLGIEGVVDYLVNNSLMIKNNQPIKNAPKRGFMPQTSHDPQLFSDLKNGITDPKRI